MALEIANHKRRTRAVLLSCLLVLLPFMRRYLIKGLSLGALK